DVAKLAPKASKPAALEPKIRAASTAITKAQKTLKGLYGFERDAKRLIAAKLEDLQKEKLRLEGEKAAGGYRPFQSVSFLDWRDENGYPRIVVFSLASNKFSINVNNHERYEFEWR